MQAPMPTPDVVLGPIMAWGKLVVSLGMGIGALLLIRARFNDFVDEFRGLRAEVKSGFQSVRDTVSNHETRLSVIEDWRERTGGA